MTLTREYTLPEATEDRLDALVARIEANPGRMLDPRELERETETLDVRPLLADPPPGLSESDLIGILKLALLTEAGTDLYANAITERARWYDADWLDGFTSRVWQPDELSHHTPYRRLMLQSGFAESEVDREIRDAQAASFEHQAGDTPVHITTYGMLQEYLTDNWHGLIARLLHGSAPVASRLIGRVKQRETLHTMWYRDMTAIQLEANPAFVRHLAETITNFHMPGEAVAPQFEAEVPRWLPQLEADLERMVRDIVRLLYQTVGDTKQAGRLLMGVAAERNIRIGPFDPAHVDIALRRLGGPGYGLVGEALLVKVGLGGLFEDRSARPSLPGRLRGLARDWVAEHMEVDLGLETA